MKNLLILICAILGMTISAQAADNYKIGDTLYVWAPSGLNIRTGAGTNHSKMGKLELGDYVVVRNITEKKYITNGLEAYGDPTAEIKGHPFQLRGKWIEVENDKYYGFLVDIYLLKFKHEVSMFDCLMNTKGEIVTTDTIETWSNGNGEIDYTVTHGFEDGTSLEVCSEGFYAANDIVLTDATIEEAYVFANYYHKLEK